MVLLANDAVAQDVVSPAASAVTNGTVGGRVVCADSNGPARFAKVFLKSATPSDAGDDLFSTFGDLAKKSKPDANSKPKLSAEEQAEQTASKAASARFMATIADMMVVTTVGMDGTYLFTNVKPGTYFVHATVAGYIDPLTAFTSEELASKDPAVLKRIAAVATMVTVNGDGARADLRMERGGAISGRVLYDDGTPAAGWTVRTVHRPASASGASGANPFAALGVDASDLDFSHITEISVTDDTGHYRIAGLPSGDYTLQARFIGSTLGTSAFNPITANTSGMGRAGAAMADRMGLRLTVYSGDALRLADAKTIPLRAGDDRSGYDLTMPLRALHSLGGRVVAKSDGHPVNSGSVDLIALDGSGKEDSSTHFTASIHDDGTFRFDYVPGGMTYVLKTSHPQDVTTTSTKRILGSTIAEQKTLKAYGPATATVQLGGSEVGDVTLAVPDMPAQSQP